jgi:adenylate kinase family enzyme
MRRINVIGSSNSGKTTPARDLAERLGPTTVVRLRTPREADGWIRSI